jgi:hypothetical protein
MIGLCRSCSKVDADSARGGEMSRFLLIEGGQLLDIPNRRLDRAKLLMKRLSPR